jgi:hypothetical protein
MVKTGTSHFSRFESSVCCLRSADEAHKKKIAGFLFWGLNLVDMGSFWKKKLHSKLIFTLRNFFFWNSELLSDPICPFITCWFKGIDRPFGGEGREYIHSICTGKLEAGLFFIILKKKVSENCLGAVLVLFEY